MSGLRLARPRWITSRVRQRRPRQESVRTYAAVYGDQRRLEDAGGAGVRRGRHRRTRTAGTGGARVGMVMLRNMKVSDYIADFDSTAAMLCAIGRYVHGKAFPALGVGSHVLKPVATAVNKLPRSFSERIYIWSGWREAIPLERLREANAEPISHWIVSQYPRRRYPAVMIGSSNGVAVHLCTALGIPWLPQTFLIPVRRSLHRTSRNRIWSGDGGMRRLSWRRILNSHCTI